MRPLTDNVYLVVRSGDREFILDFGRFDHTGRDSAVNLAQVLARLLAEHATATRSLAEREERARSKGDDGRDPSVELFTWKRDLAGVEIVRCLNDLDAVLQAATLKGAHGR